MANDNFESVSLNRQADKIQTRLSTYGLLPFDNLI